MNKMGCCFSCLEGCMNCCCCVKSIERKMDKNSQDWHQKTAKQHKDFFTKNTSRADCFWSPENLKSLFSVQKRNKNRNHLLAGENKYLTFMPVSISNASFYRHSDWRLFVFLTTDETGFFYIRHKIKKKAAQ